MARDGITYSVEKENEIINMMSVYMKNSGMDSKQIRYLLSYDQDYIPDQLFYLSRDSAWYANSRYCWQMQDIF